jgi:two-component system, OmpR family, sensor histidine kinase ChvG
LLDRTAEVTPYRAETERPDEQSAHSRRTSLANILDRVGRVYRDGGVRGIAQRAWQFFISQSFSSLTRRIVSLNVAGLVALAVGVLYLSQFRAGLIDARVESLVVQGEIIAGAIAASATADNYGTYIDRDRLLELQPGANESDEGLTGFEFSINPERVAPVLRRLISPTKTRARIYDTNGYLIIDSRNLYLPGEVLRLDLPPPNAKKPNIFKRGWLAFRSWIGRGDLPRYHEFGSDAGKDYTEVAQALNGAKSASMVRVNDRGEVIVSVAVPVQRFRAVRGALLLSTQGGDINQAVEAERLQIVKLFGILLVVMVVLSILLARGIANPVKRLADSAERVRHRTRSRVEIPDLTARRDEIGDLSGSLREMTNALYSRIEAIERFAADVAHELKNPLTSLRSAVETLPLAKSPDSQQRLLAVIQHDVRRLDRLISDISDASRLDAELQRGELAPVDLMKLLNTVVAVQNETRPDEAAKASITFEGGGKLAFVVPGHDSRLGQVINNLIDNARSFAPSDSTVRVTCRRLRDEVEITVDDDGPGINPEAFDKIFERFYTDRPHQGFGQNSGLGLSISKQIIEAHRGRLWAENRTAVTAYVGDEPRVLGARFTVRLPTL